MSIQKGDIEVAKMMMESYNAGIKKVLTEVAKVHYIQQQGQSLETAPDVKAATQEYTGIFESLKETLNDEQIGLLMKLADAGSVCAAFEAEDVFYRAFIEGYQFHEKIYGFWGMHLNDGFHDHGQHSDC